MYKLLLMLLLSTSLFSKVVWEIDFNSGLDSAKKVNKPVLFVYSSHNCRYCTLLEETTLSDKRVMKVLQEDFISIISYTDENDYTPRELRRPATPTIWFLKPSGEPMFQPIMGAIGKENFLGALGEVKKAYALVKKEKEKKTEVKKETKKESGK